MSKLQDTAKRLREAADTLEQLYAAPTAPDIKSELLKRYAQGRPVLFCQVDGFTNIHPGDCVMPADKDRHCVMQSEVYELRRTSHAVRLQIRQGTTAKEAIALLEKMLDCVKTLAAERGPDAFEYACEGYPDQLPADDFEGVPF